MAYTPRSDGDKDDAPEVEKTSENQAPIELLGPGTDKHSRVLAYLLERLKLSEDAMSVFYDRWRVNERKVQAYIDLPEYDKILKEMNKNSGPANPISITVPYAYATVWTITTYLMHTFCGRKPIFQVGTYKKEQAAASRHMETILQYNADHTRLVKHLIQFFLDGSIYGVAAMRTLWNVERKKRSIWVKESPGGLLTPGSAATEMRRSEERITYEGNDVMSIDPFLFFPDPRVPMSEVNRKGEFVFWRSYESTVYLKKAQAQGKLKWIDSVGNLPINRLGDAQSSRSIIATGQPVAGSQLRQSQSHLGKPFAQIDQCTIEVCPYDIGLGDSRDPEKWLFSIANKAQIIQAEPFDADHDMHPVAVIEPSSFGYGFGQAGVTDFLGPIQDTLSWFVNSHIHNVRSVINNSIVYDPSMVEEQDLKNPRPGKLIRLKRAAYGQDVRTALQQLQVVDVTRGHISDLQTFMRIGDSISAVNDNLRGLQEAGGRKTATEVRTSGEAGASRLAATSRIISAQGMVDLAEMMSVNIQQNQTMDFYLKIIGSAATEGPTNITPQSLAGDFYFPVHDGTLPLDRVALFDVWKEIMLAIMQSEQLQMSFPLTEIFKHVADLGGAPDLSNYEVKPQIAPPPAGAAPPGGPAGGAVPSV